MRNTLIGTLTALLCALILFGAQVAALQDDSFIIRTENHTGNQSRWLLQAISDHPDALHFGLSISPFPNSFCPPGDVSKDVVYQLGMNATSNGAARVDPAFGAITINWESNWCNTAGVRMSEWQVRAIGDQGRVRFYHVEFTPATNWMSNRIFGDLITLGQWNVTNTIEIQ